MVPWSKLIGFLVWRKDPRGAQAEKRPSEEATCKPRREASEETKPASTLTLKVQAPKLWEHIFLSWKHPVCGALWRQPEQTNMLTLGQACDSLRPERQENYDISRDWKSGSCCSRDLCQWHCEQVCVNLLDGQKHMARPVVTPASKSTPEAATSLTSSCPAVQEDAADPSRRTKELTLLTTDAQAMVGVCSH